MVLARSQCIYITPVALAIRLRFLGGMIIASLLEYFTSWFLEKAFPKRWRDYSQHPLNLNGRICLLGALTFGLFVFNFG